MAAPRLARTQPAWPDRPIRWIVNFPPGGAADILSRTLAEHLGGRFGQPIIIENRPGAGGMIGSDILAKARGDTHLVMLSNAASHGIGPVLYASVPYDPLADFTHLHMVGTFPSVLAVGPAFAGTTLADLVQRARARPGEISYGSGGNGTMNHLIGQLLARAAGIELTLVPYRGSAPAMADTIGGQIPALMESLPTVIGHLRANRLRALATSESVRAPALPDVPTFAESGYPDVVSTNWFGFSAPANIPGVIAERWRAEVADALTAAPVRDRFASIGVKPGIEDAHEYTSLIRRELTRWRDVIRAGNIRAE